MRASAMYSLAVFQMLVEYLFALDTTNDLRQSNLEHKNVHLNE